MKRILVILGFLLAACGTGGHEPPAPDLDPDVGEPDLPPLVVPETGPDVAPRADWPEWKLDGLEHCEGGT